MNVFAYLFGQTPEAHPAVERAVNAVEPLLKQTGDYPEAFRAPVQAALEYAHELAMRVPGPVTISRESYASDPLVHALFPSLNSIVDAMDCSLPLHDHLQQFPAGGEVYALMGMRRIEKAVVGMRLSGQLVQHDVVQNMVYFTSHTVDHPAPSEAQARELIAMSLFDRLIGKVAQRIAQRKERRLALQQEKEVVSAQLRNADKSSRADLELRLARLLDELQETIGSLELGRYPDDFVAILLDPAPHLRLEQVEIRLDSMGIKHPENETGGGHPIVFDELIGYDRRNWTVTLVRCSGLEHEAFSSRLDRAWRSLSV